MKRRVKGILCFVFALAVVLCVAAALGTEDAYADQTIDISGEKKLSDLVADGLTSDDTINVSGDATLILDMNYNISKITGSHYELTVQETGSHILTVRNGVSVGTNGTLNLDSGTIIITGPLSSSNVKGFYGQNLYVNGGKLRVSFYSSSQLYGIDVIGNIKTTGGQIEVDVEGSHINIYAISTYYLETDGGTIDSRIKTSSGYAYGIKAYEVYAKNGTIKVDSSRNTTGTYGYVYGIYTQDLTVDDASIEVNASSVESYSIGVCTNLLDVNGGYISSAAETTTVNKAADGFNVYSQGSDTANWTINAGCVTASGTSPSGGTQSCGRGINIPVGIDVIFTIQGGIVNSTGSYAGIYVTGDSSLEIKGNAVVTAASTGDSGNGIYTVTDLVIGGSAHVNVRSEEYNGIYTFGRLSIIDKASVDAVGGGNSGDNRCALYAGGGITLGTNQKITIPSGGSISPSGKVILDPDSSRSIVVQINYATYISPDKVYIDGGRYFGSDKLFWKNDEGFIGCSPSSPAWNAMYEPATGTLYLRNYDGNDIGLSRTGITDKKLIVVLIGENRIKKSQFGIYADKNDLEITSPGYGGTLEIYSNYSSGGGGSSAAIAVQWANPDRDNSITVSGNAGVYVNISSNEEIRGFSAGSDIIIRDHAVVDVNVTYGRGATTRSYAFMNYNDVIIATDKYVNASVKGNDQWINFDYGNALSIFNGYLKSFQVGNAEYVSLSVLGRSSEVFPYAQDDKIERMLEDGLFMGYGGFRSPTRDTDKIYLQKGYSSGGQIPVTGAYFPDMAFRAYVSDHFDTDEDGWLSSSEINNTKEIEYVDSYPAVYSVEGVEYFTELESFEWLYDYIRTLYLSSNKALEFVFASENFIDVADFTGLSNLTYLDLYDNDIEHLYLSTLENLKYLECSGNELDSLDLTGCPNLTTLKCSWNIGLQSLDLSPCPDLLYLETIDNENITEIDMDSNSKLQHIDIDCCALPELDVSGKPDLEFLNCIANGLNTLDVSSNNKLRALYCQNNGLTDLKLGNKPDLEELRCYGNQLSVLDLSGCPIVKDAYLHGTHQTETNAHGDPIYEWYYLGDGDLRMDGSTTVFSSLATLKAANLTLEGKITINFKVASDVEGLIVKFYYEKNGFGLVKEEALTSANRHSDSSGEYYLVSYDQVPAKEMTQTLRIKLFDAQGNQGQFKTSQGYIDQYDYSVATWCNNRIAKSTDPKEVNLAKALLNYGHYTQLDLKFMDGRDGRPNKLANPNGYLASEMNGVTANTAYSSVINNGKDLGAKAFALVLESNTSIKLKLKRQVGVTINGAAATLHPETDNDGTQIWAVFKDDIPAKKLHERQTFKLTEGSNSATMYYGALSWANSKLNGSNVDEKNLAKAMYLYNYAARRYFNYDASGL